MGIAMGREKRLFYRIEYPEDFMPKLIIGESEGKKNNREKEYTVMDICEGGVKFTSNEELSGFQLSSKIEAQVTFSDGELFVVKGEVLRCSDNQVVIYPSEEIPSSKVMTEQEFAENLRRFGIYLKGNLTTIYYF